MSVSVYVGKDVEIKIQNPMEEDVSSQANGSQTVFTVSKTPISDRDQDGVANEPAHVTVYVNGSEVTVSAVNDSTGEVTLASAPAQGSRVIIEYRYDSTPEIAQEISIAPKQTIEEITGLGSNTIQEWALLLKEFSGSLKELFRKTEQFSRVTKKKLDSRYSQQFWTSGALDDFQGDTGNFTVDAQQLKVTTDLDSKIGVKNSVLPTFKDGVIRCKVKKNTGGDHGFIFRWDGISPSGNWYYIVIDGTFKRIIIHRVKSGVDTTLFTSPGGLNWPSDFFPMEIRFIGAEITVVVNETWIFSVHDPDPLLIDGMPGMHAYYGNTDRWDDFQVWQEKTDPDDYGMIVKWDQGGSAVRIGLDKVIFPEGSIPSPKNKPSFILTPFKAQRAKTIS